MLALGFGLTAAVLWAVHDLLARKLSQGTALLPILVAVMVSGCVVLLPCTIFAGGWSAITGTAVALSALSWMSIVLAMGSLYKAFSIAPVRLVSPVGGAYPMLSLGIAMLQGREVTGADWLAVLAICIGVPIVAL